MLPGNSTNVTHQDLVTAGWKRHDLPGHMGHTGPLWSLAGADGLWRYGLLLEAKHLNPAGLAHGGVLLTLADHAMSAVAWQHKQRLPCVTVQLDSQFVASAKAGDFVVCDAQITHSTHSMVFVRAQLWAQAQLLLNTQSIMKVLSDRTLATNE